MDLEEAKLKAKITEEERFAVGNYITSFHASMNTLIGFNMLDYFEAKKRGWLMPGFDPSKSKEETGDEVLDWIDKAGSIYSAMVKSLYEYTPPYKLMRGTTIKEANGLRTGTTYDRLLSTTTEEDIAKRFAPTGNEAVLLRIAPGRDIPFINVTEFMGGEDNLNRLEKEYILAPFTRVASSTYRSNWGGYKYYDVGLERPEMRPFEEGEKDSLREEIRANFDDMIKLGAEWEQVCYKLEEIPKRLGTERDQDMRRYLHEEQDAMWKRYDELSPKITAFEQTMKHYVQGIFAEREREVVHARALVAKEEARIRKEEQEAKDRETIAQESEAIKTNTSKLNGIDNTPAMFYSTYESLKTEEARFRDMSQALGIPFDMQLPTKSMSGNLQDLEEHIKTIRSRIDEISNLDFQTGADARKASIEIGQYTYAFDKTKEQRDPLYRVSEDYTDEAMFGAKKGIDEKIQEMIKRTKLQVIAMKKKEVQERKISFWGRLRGLDKLQEAELRNLGLEEQIAKQTPILSKSEYSVHDSLAELRAFSKRELDGLATDEMKQFDMAVRRFFGVDDSEISARADMKLRNSLPAVIEKPKRRLSTAKKIAKANERTQSLQAELLDVQNSGASDNGHAAKTSASIKSFLQILEDTIQVTMPVPEMLIQRKMEIERQNNNNRNTETPIEVTIHHHDFDVK